MEQGITWEDRVKGAYASLRPSEQKVAEFFLAHAEELEDLTIGELARGAGVSEPTVIRCVRGLGYRGYREFKGALSQKEGQVRGNALDYLGGFALRPWERMGDLPLKAVRTHRAQLEETLKSVPTGELERAARILAGAQFIDIYGVENSCAPASDLLTKLTYLGLPCRFHTDAYLQQIGAAHLRPGAAAIAFSHSGKSMDTVKALRLAQKAGAVTIAVAGGEDPVLFRYADVALGVGGNGPDGVRQGHLLPGGRLGGGGYAVHGGDPQRLRALLPQLGPQRPGDCRPGLPRPVTPRPGGGRPESKQEPCRENYKVPVFSLTGFNYGFTEVLRDNGGKRLVTFATLHL